MDEVSIPARHRLKCRTFKSEKYVEVAQDVLTVINEADDDEEYIMTAAELGLAQAHCFATKFDCQIHFDAVEHHTSEPLPYNSRKISLSVIQGVFSCQHCTKTGRPRLRNISLYA